MLDKIKNINPINGIKEKVNNISKEQVSNIKDKMNDTIKEYSIIIDELLPFIQKIGYKISEVEIEIGVPPKVIVHFLQFQTISQEDCKKVLLVYEKHVKNKNKISKMILESLIKASNMQNIVSIGNLKFKEVEIEMGLIPSVIVKFL